MRALIAKIKRMSALLAADIRSLFPAIVIIVLYYVLALKIFGHFCPSRILLGITCPGCGLTRGSLCLITFRFREAFRYNPAVFLWVPYLFYLIFFRYVREKEAPLRLPLFIALMVISTLIWLIRLPYMDI